MNPGCRSDAVGVYLQIHQDSLCLSMDLDACKVLDPSQCYVVLRGFFDHVIPKSNQRVLDGLIEALKFRVDCSKTR